MRMTSLPRSLTVHVRHVPIPWAQAPSSSAAGSDIAPAELPCPRAGTIGCKAASTQVSTGAAPAPAALAMLPKLVGSCCRRVCTCAGRTAGAEAELCDHLCVVRCGMTLMSVLKVFCGSSRAICSSSAAATRPGRKLRYKWSECRAAAHQSHRSLRSN